MGLILDSRIFRGQTESIPAHGMQHVETLHGLETRHNIADGIVAHMAHMDLARGIREHFKHVVLRLVMVHFDLEAAGFIPDLLPLLFNFFRIVLA